MEDKKKPLKKLKTGAIGRSLSLAKLSFSAGAKVASHKFGNLFADESEKDDRFKAMVRAQVDRLAKELGELKGSLMKVGQLLSMYGEHFLPEEANRVLKSLQSESVSLEWAEIEKVIKRELSPEVLSQLDIDQEPMASASLGQVHRAIRKSDGKELAIKVQYPGVDRAIDGDLRALRSMLSLAKVLPDGPRYDALFEEVKTMLHQEVDYTQELRSTTDYQKKVEGDPRYIIPEVHPEFSTRRILTTTLMKGVGVDSPEVKALSQERRDGLGKAALELYFRELYEFGEVQTDPHFGNYRIQLSEDPSQPDRWVLLDFGAVRKLNPEFLSKYLLMVSGAFFFDEDDVIEGATALGFLKDSDSDAQREAFVKLCSLITEPFAPEGHRQEAAKELFDSNGGYHWSKSDLPTRAAKLGSQLALLFKLRSPPAEIVFLDRKLGGIFILLSTLKVTAPLRDLVEPFPTKFLKSRSLNRS